MSKAGKETAEANVDKDSGLLPGEQMPLEADFKYPVTWETGLPVGRSLRSPGYSYHSVHLHHGTVCFGFLHVGPSQRGATLTLPLGACLLEGHLTHLQS